MAETRTLARPYAEAIFSLASERKELQQWATMLGLLADVGADERISALVGDPRISKEHVTGLLVDICGNQLTADGKNLARLLVENERFHLIADIATQFEQLKADAEGTLEVEAISAFELDDAQMKSISQAMQKKLGREVKLVTKLDKSLIGGVVIRAGDLVIDGSVTGRLRELAAQLN
ncbi:MAG: F0F1 ATP synthase subunit delta [Gammaproteobacteria bacterium]|nr:F0F1 ATP synthase subunit delta [Gammaproteobacteria bacterium]